MTNGHDFNAERHKLQSHMMRTVLVVLFLVYPSLSAKMLSVFNCKDIHGQSYLIGDILLACYTTEHNLYMSLAAIGMAVYAIGIPLGFLWLMFYYQVPSLAKHKRNCHIFSRALEYVLKDDYSRDSPVYKDQPGFLRWVTSLVVLIAYTNSVPYVPHSWCNFTVKLSRFA